MRIRNLFGAAIVALATIGLCSAIPMWLGRMQYVSTTINRNDARSVSATHLSKDNWVEFQILRDAKLVRFLTNAALDEADATDHDLSRPRTGWRYSIEYQLLDRYRNLLRESTYHFRSTVRQIRDQETGQILQPIFLGKSGLAATQTRPMHVSLDDQKGKPAILRVRVHSADQKIRDLVGRSLSLIERDEFEKKHTWNRLSNQRREAICKFMVYPHDILPADERASLLRWRWVQTPPVSSSLQRHLYFIGDLDDTEVREEQFLSGLYADPTRRVTIPIPEGPGRVSLEAFVTGAGEKSERSITWRWIGPKTHHRVDLFKGVDSKHTGSHTLVSPKTKFDIVVDGGIIEIDSPHKVVLRAHWKADAMPFAESIDITPAPLIAKTYIVDQHPLEYAIHHHDNQPTPFRLRIRNPLTSAPGVPFDHFGDPDSLPLQGEASKHVPPRLLRWELLNDSGDTVGEGRIEVPPNVSKFDHFEIAAGSQSISEPVDRFFLIPPTIRKIRLRSESEWLVASASVRPAGVPRTTHVPEDYQSFQSRRSVHRTWFSLNPPDSDRRVQSGRTIIVHTQPRPPEIDPQIISGDFEWSRLVPTGDWIGRQLLVPFESALDVTSSSTRATYFEMVPGETYRTKPLESPVAPPAKLLVVADEPPGWLTVRVRGEVVFRQRVESKRSEWDLSKALARADGPLAIHTTSSARLFLTGRQVPDAAPYRKRTAQRFDQGELRFPVLKQSTEAETITLQIFRPKTAQDRFPLRVRIESSPLDESQTCVPTESLTVRDRIFELRPLNDLEDSVVLGTDQHADIGHRCFITLGTDLLPGSYVIRIEPFRGHEDAFALVYRTLPRRNPVRNLRIQSIDDFAAE